MRLIDEMMQEKINFGGSIMTRLEVLKEMQELGFKEDEIPLLAKIAFDDPQTIGNPRDLSVKSYEQIYQRAFELGK